MRAVWLDVYYDGLDQPSVSVPCLDFFAIAHGRPVAYDSALTSVHEGHGFNTYIPMPFRDHVRVELTNFSSREQHVYYQIDYTLEQSLPPEAGYLHVSFRRENPTVQRRDFVIVEGLEGPGRFLGCAVGVRVLDEGVWYGAGEVKIYRDGDTEFPTICGTGVEDYVGTAWGMGQHVAAYAGAPLVVEPPGTRGQPAFVSFYRWHLPDPVVFTRELRVTLQQIGYAMFGVGDSERFERYAASHPAAGAGWDRRDPRFAARGIVERADDYCATAFVYCAKPQLIPRPDVAIAIADIGRLEHELRLTLTDVVTSIDFVAAAVGSERPTLPGHAIAPDGTVTIMFSDIEDSTPLAERLGDSGWMEVLRAHNALIREQLDAHGGFEVKTIGDAFMVAFQSAGKALDCAIAIQRAFAEFTPLGVEHVRVRIGLHAGDAVREADDFYGKNVILASRIAGKAHGGEILVSSLLRQLVESSVDASMFGEPRDVELKGLAGAHTVFAVGWSNSAR
jgi:class 3 adenylate cyclase